MDIDKRIAEIEATNIDYMRTDDGDMKIVDDEEKAWLIDQLKACREELYECKKVAIAYADLNDEARKIP